MFEIFIKEGKKVSSLVFYKNSQETKSKKEK